MPPRAFKDLYEEARSETVLWRRRAQALSSFVRSLVADQDRLPLDTQARLRGVLGMLATFDANVGKRRRGSRSPEEKARILREYDAAPHGKRASVRRRYGLHLQSIYNWRKQLGQQASAYELKPASPPAPSAPVEAPTPPPPTPKLPALQPDDLMPVFLDGRAPEDDQ